MKKFKPILEIICYLVLPIVIWKYGREPLGDYYAMLLSTGPAFIYTVWNFFNERQFNVSGLYIMSSLMINTILDLISDSAEWMLWNGIYFNFGMIAFLLFTIIIKRPIVMYFLIDAAYVQGTPREESKKKYRSKELFIYFQWLTAFLILRDVLESGLKIWLINKYGVDGYGQILISMRTFGWVMSVVFVAAVMYVFNKIMQYTEKEEQKLKEKEVAVLNQSIELE
ncbi:VC0807 family protein [Calidifontibacillus oryziterrae]|uniref:VC0807 family protein n=1 Tax=Calidifontibacillus oryziterrae TaxID=1191699 RepID=UPI0002E65E56|nr:VC0807 family protein [Calidifontibacillus oryziterrae]